MKEKRWGIFCYKNKPQLDLCGDKIFSSKNELLKYFRKHREEEMYAGKKCFIGCFEFKPFQEQENVHFSNWAMISVVGYTDSLGVRDVHFKPLSNFWKVLQKELSVSA